MARRIILNPTDLETQWELALPQKLKEFFLSNAWQEFEGHQISDLYGFSSDVRSAITFKDRDDLPDKFEYAREFADDQTFFPLADLPDLDGTFFVAVDLADDALPVYFFDYESGFQEHASSLEEFLAGLLPPGARTPAEELDKLLEKARALYKKKQYEKAKNTLESGLASIGPVKNDTFDQYRGMPAAARNLLALCYKGLGNTDRAMELFELAVEEGDKSAALNIMSIYIDQGAWQTLVDYAEEKAKSMLMLWDDYSAYYSFLYRGIGYMQLGNANHATKYFGFIAARFLEKKPERITEAVERLEELLAKSEKNEPTSKTERQEAAIPDDSEPMQIAGRILAWLKPPELALSKTEQIELQSWWSSLDEEVQESLADALDKEPEEMAIEDLDALIRRTSLKIENRNIEDIQFLSRFKRLRTLSVEGNEIADIAPLANMPTLVDLNLSENPLQSIGPLSGLLRLQELDLSECGLKDLAHLSGLKQLRKLRLNENQIQSVEALANLHELVELTLYDNEIENLNPLQSNTLLKEISCFSNPLEEAGVDSVIELRSLPLLQEVDAHWRNDKVDPEQLKAWQAARPFTVAMDDTQHQEWRDWWDSLPDAWRAALEDELEEMDKEGYPTLEAFFELRKENHLSLGKKNLQTIDPLTRLSRLDYVNLSRNGISVLPDLSGLQCLRTIHLDDNRIADLRPFEAVPYLAYLDLDKNELKDLKTLPTLPYLRRLDLNNNQIADLSPVAKAPGIRRLELIGNQIQDVKPLAGLTELRELFLQENQIKDISPLAACENLEELVVFSNANLQGLLALKDLRYLHTIRAHGAFESEAIKDFRSIRPDVDLL